MSEEFKPVLLEHDYKWLERMKERDIFDFVVRLGQFIRSCIRGTRTQHRVLEVDEVNKLDREALAQEFVDDMRAEKYRFCYVLHDLLDFYESEEALVEDIAQRIDWQLPRIYLRIILADENTERGDRYKEEAELFENGQRGLFYQLPKREVLGENKEESEFADTTTKRRILRLPIKSDLRYMRSNGGTWEAVKVTGYKIVEYYEPSHTASLLIQTEEGEEKRILAPYFAEMQKANFGKEETTEE